MKNLKKVLTIIAVAGVLALGIIGVTKGVDVFATKGAWGYVLPVVNTI